MKNLETILTDFSIEIPADKKVDFLKVVNENYKTISDWQNQKDKVANLTEQLNTTKDELKKFEGVDANGLNEKIANLTKQLAEKENDYMSKIADRDFQDLLHAAIASNKGLNAKAITALLDIDALKQSKNQKDDIGKAVKNLAEAEDSKMLFGSDVPTVVGNVNPIGTVSKVDSNTNISKMRSIMGLPIESKGEK